MLQTYTSDELMRCDPPPGCEGCAWSPLAEEICDGACIGEREICPWLMACPCLNGEGSPRWGHRLERLALQQPPQVQTAPAAVPAGRLRLGAYEIRQERDEETIRRIAASIADNGLFAPPGGVASYDEEAGACIDVLMGGNRVIAMRELLGWEAVPVRVFHWWGEDVWERKVAAFQENGLRQQMTFEEEVALVYAYWRRTGRTVRQIAGRFRMSKSWVHERIAWGKRAFGDGLPPDPSPDLDLAARRRRTKPRVSFQAEEVQAWLAQLATLGLPAPNGRGNNGGSRVGQLREGMRETMAVLLEELDEGAVGLEGEA